MNFSLNGGGVVTEMTKEDRIESVKNRIFQFDREELRLKDMLKTIREQRMRAEDEFGDLSTDVKVGDIIEYQISRGWRGDKQITVRAAVRRVFGDSYPGGTRVHLRIIVHRLTKEGKLAGNIGPETLFSSDNLELRVVGKFEDAKEEPRS